LEDIPVYGNTPRVKVRNLASKWQEIEIKAHSFEEMDHEGFWEFLETAISSFNDKIKRIDSNIEDHMPWTKLGQKWHFLRKGFPPGKKVRWDIEVLEMLHNVLQEAAPQGQFLWNNKQVVHVFVPEQKEPWVSISTKKTDALWLQISGPQNSLSLGSVVDIVEEPTITTVNKRDVLKMSFSDPEQVAVPDFKEFLQKHLKSLSA
jgi:excinuclease ABC subunit A